MSLTNVIKRLVTKPPAPAPQAPVEDLRITEAPDPTAAQEAATRIERERQAHVRREDAEAARAWELRWIVEEKRKDERRRKEIERQRVEAVKRGEVYKEPEAPKPQGHIGHAMGTSIYDHFGYGYGNPSAHPGLGREIHHHYH